MAAYIDPKAIPPAAKHLFRTSSVESLSTSSDSSYDSTDSRELARLQTEYEESIKQLQMLVSVVVLPFLGKWLGRKVAYAAWGRFLDVGLGLEFFGGKFASAWIRR